MSSTSKLTLKINLLGVYGTPTKTLAERNKGMEIKEAGLTPSSFENRLAAGSDCQTNHINGVTIASRKNMASLALQLHGIEHSFIRR